MPDSTDQGSEFKPRREQYLLFDADDLKGGPVTWARRGHIGANTYIVYVLTRKTYVDMYLASRNVPPASPSHREWKLGRALRYGSAVSGRSMSFLHTP